MPPPAYLCIQNKQAAGFSRRLWLGCSECDTVEQGSGVCFFHLCGNCVSVCSVPPSMVTLLLCTSGKSVLSSW